MIAPAVDETLPNGLHVVIAAVEGPRVVVELGRVYGVTGAYVPGPWPGVWVRGTMVRPGPSPASR